MNTPTVLCIDDRPQVLELRKAALESHRCRVKIESSSYAARRCWTKLPGCGSTGVQRGRHGRGGRNLPYHSSFPICRSS